ncbi:MAG: hypothetical protein CAF42_002745 [Nitrospira sp. CG24B]|nr:MAG: hypothetical protein CAF42_002745 [Nitrospira sp. CG24B]
MDLQLVLLFNERANPVNNFGERSVPRHPVVWPRVILQGGERKRFTRPSGMPSQIGVPNVIAVAPVLAGDEWCPGVEHLIPLANIDQFNLCKRMGRVLIPDGLKEPIAAASDCGAR